MYCISFTPVNAAIPDDAYITGYATALLEREFHLSHTSLQVQQGVIQVDADDLTGVDQQQLVTSLANIPGVVQVELRGRGQL